MDGQTHKVPTQAGDLPQTSSSRVDFISAQAHNPKNLISSFPCHKSQPIHHVALPSTYFRNLTSQAFILTSPSVPIFKLDPETALSPNSLTKPGLCPEPRNSLSSLPPAPSPPQSRLKPQQEGPCPSGRQYLHPTQRRQAATLIPTLTSLRQRWPPR